MFPSIIFDDLHFNVQRIDDCSLDCNLAEITSIRDLPGQFGACAQNVKPVYLIEKLLLIQNLYICMLSICVPFKVVNIMSYRDI